MTSPLTPPPAVPARRVDQDTPSSPLTPISPWPPSFPGDDGASFDALPNATDLYASIAILGTYVLFGTYLLWAFSPEGGWWVAWLPHRQWALIVPCWLMVVVLLTYFSYGALVLYRTPGFDSLDCITDPQSGIPPGRRDGEEPYYWKYAEDDAPAEAVDLPLDLVNRVLYRRRVMPEPADGR
ncbi:hypothetical protein IAU60_001323 [Kwoniella sp. DSM 27419]